MINGLNAGGRKGTGLIQDRGYEIKGSREGLLFKPADLGGNDRHVSLFNSQ
jgi:hypothetical protein